ncbi:hypothetical protein BJ322DRAFT_1208279 [Thelephora terrestris]|uniref:Uncharacterized protein n=1 Tax=Thelephora terrestris TaxID=56493 RepID=A0A9P6HN24_9AGAM|nr:hypothetical protein BJ322DRAFT_1208279 [Thelephora terrestris]
MPTRSAEEAQLSDTDDETRNIRLKTRNTRLKTTHETPIPTAETAQANSDVRLLDPLSYVNIPTPHPLDIQGWHRDRALEHVDSHDIHTWMDNYRHKVLVYKAYGGRIEDRKEEVKIRDLIKTTLGMEFNPTIIVPKPAKFNPTIIVPEPDTMKGPRPFCALVQGMGQQHADDLISRKYISTKDISIFIIPFSSAPTTFVTTLTGFRFRDETDQETEAIVKSVVERTLFDGDDSPATMYLKRLATPLRNNIPDPMNESVCEAIRYLRASIVFRRLAFLRFKGDVSFAKKTARLRALESNLPVASSARENYWKAETHPEPYECCRCLQESSTLMNSVSIPLPISGSLPLQAEHDL